MDILAIIFMAILIFMAVIQFIPPGEEEKEKIREKAVEEEKRQAKERESRIRENQIEKMKRYYRGKESMIARIEGIEQMPDRFRNMAYLLCDGDHVSIRKNKYSKSDADRLEVFIDGKYPIGYVQEVMAEIVDDNLYGIMDVSVYRLDEKKPKDLYMNISFAGPIEILSDYED